MTASHSIDDMTAEVWEFDEVPFKSSIAQRKMDAGSKPRIVPGRSGNAVLFDGVDDRLRSFTNVPSDDLTLSFHFKVSPRNTYSSHALTTLYGMYNTTIGLEWSDQPLLRDNRGESGIITSPSPVSVTPLPWPETASPFLYEGMLYVMTASGQLLVEGPLGWQDFPSDGNDIEARLGNPWPTQEGICAISDKGILWSWTPTSGWNSLGAVQHEYQPLSEVIPCGDGAFLQGENQWVWADSDSKDLKRPANGVPGLVREVAWGFKGHEVTFEKGDRQFWHPLRTQMLLGPTGATLTKHWSWYWLIPVLCIAMAITATLKFRKNQNHRESEHTPHYRPTPPPDLQPLLVKLQAHCDQAIETSQLDDVLGAVTNKLTSLAEPLIAQIGLNSYFDLIVCGDTTPHAKPDPAPVNFALNNLGVSASNALFVGDSDTDVKAAKASHCAVVCLRNGYNHGTDVTTLAANGVIDDCRELL